MQLGHLNRVASVDDTDILAGPKVQLGDHSGCQTGVVACGCALDIVIIVRHMREMHAAGLWMGIVSCDTKAGKKDTISDRSQCCSMPNTGLRAKRTWHNIDW